MLIELIKKILKSIMICMPDRLKIRVIKFLDSFAGELYDYNRNVQRNNIRKNIADLGESLYFEDVQEKTLDKAVEEKDRKKYNIRFFHTQPIAWNAIRSLVNAFKEDSKYNVKIILWNNRWNNDLEQQMKEEILDYCFDTDYSAEMDRPDIFITYHSFVNFVENILNIRTFAKKIYVVSMNVILEGDTNEHLRQMKLNNAHLQPDYYLIEKYVYNCLRKEGLLESNMIMMGNPKFDEIYEHYVLYTREYSKSQIGEGKKVILWTTDHGYFWDGVSSVVAFDLYARTIFDFFKKHKDYLLIFRPHPNMIYELLDRQYMTYKEYMDFRIFCNNSDNIIWDDSKDYCRSFAACDAIIADAGCGIILSALPLLKPMAVLLRNDMPVVIDNPDIIDSYIKINNIEECELFLEKFEEDLTLEKRKGFLQESIMHFDGKNGERIKQFIETDFEDLNHE